MIRKLRHDGRGRGGAIAVPVPLLALLVLLAAPPVAAEIFKYRDSVGNVHFTDRPMHGNVRLEWRSSEYESAVPARFDAEAYRLNIARATPLITAAAQRHRLNAELLHAVVRAESAYDPRAVSRAGAVGLMQLMPETARRFGVADRYDPRANLDAGARYLRELLERFDHDLELALAAYNAGENAVERHGNQIPPYPETRDYVRKVIGYYADRRAVAAR